jgi:hypothetical protein
MAWFKRVHRPNAPICGLSKNKPPSTDEHKYDDVRCVMFGLGLGARRAHPPSGAATDEQRRPRPNTTQPFGRQSFLPQASLLAPHRPMKGMLVARVSPAPKIPCREHHRIDVHQYLATPTTIPHALHCAISFLNERELRRRAMKKPALPQGRATLPRIRPHRNRLGI